MSSEQRKDPEFQKRMDALKCTTCGKQFLIRSAMLLHQRTQHAGHNGARLHLSPADITKAIELNEDFHRQCLELERDKRSRYFLYILMDPLQLPRNLRSVTRTELVVAVSQAIFSVGVSTRWHVYLDNAALIARGQDWDGSGAPSDKRAARLLDTGVGVIPLTLDSNLTHDEAHFKEAQLIRRLGLDNSDNQVPEWGQCRWDITEAQIHAMVDCMLWWAMNCVLFGTAKTLQLIDIPVPDV